MFPSFTGNSRRPRNVNLSGQRNANPWANSGWTSAPTGASQTVANAQAEREKRQRERDVQAATKRLQRVWRGHKTRRNAKAQHRKEWDDLYSKNETVPDPERVTRALPLILALFEPGSADDQRRLDQFVQDWSASEPWDFESRQWDKLACLLVAALERRSISSSHHLLSILIGIIKKRPSSITGVSDRYYKLISAYCKQSGKNVKLEMATSEQQSLAEAISTPLAQVSPGLQAYEAFAFSFLTTADILFVEQMPTRCAKFLDLETLSRSIIAGFKNQERVHQSSRDGLMWLLAHFIALNRATSTSQGAAYLEALYRQLTELAADIRLRTAPPDEDNESSDELDESASTNPLPSYILSQLNFLHNEDGIAELLSRFTSTAASGDANLLAGYTLILLRCFPSHGDDIKMRLFQGDISTKDDSSTSTNLPSVKYFWKAASRTSIFSSIKTEQRARSVDALLKPDSVRDQEWRTMLLFLELYNFLLRVTDDEDFLPAENEVVPEHSPAVLRIRSSGLDLPELKELIFFLKNLSFSLYYNLSDIMPTMARTARQSVSAIFQPSASREIPEDLSPTSFAGVMGMDILTLRASTTAAMRSLYERDSRRQFLPKDFWLMTSRFDMDGFLSAVVLEEQRKDEAEDEDDEMSDVGADRDSFHTASGHRISRAAQIERQQQYRKVQREKLLAQVGPKLEILRNMPFTIPFEVRVKIFRQFVQLDKTKRRGGHVDPDQWRLSLFGQTRGRDVLDRHTATIKRGQVFEDAYDQFYSLGDGLKEPIQITFVDQFDQAEAGIDGGGVTKEFLTSITNEAFSGGDFFVANSKNLLHPKPTAFDEAIEALRYEKVQENSAQWTDYLQQLTKQYEFLGRVVGKCMYESILIDIAFASFFLLKWSSSSSSTDFRANLNDLRDLDEDLYKGLIVLKNYPGDVSDMSLDFTINDRINTLPEGVRTVTRPLRKDGENIPVTNKDRPLYISYVAHHRLVAQPYRQTKAFLRGLGSIINPSWLSMFNQSELQRLVGGDSSEIDVEDLRRNTKYSGLYAIGDDGLEHPTVQMFWQVMHGLKDSERRDVLKYVTSTPRAPLLGFAQLSPSFSIRDGGTDEERLPSTSTCVNLLKLPRYSSATTLRNKLIYAVQSGAGFDLS
ncbi:HECT-domain-containing protein [Xylariales sp. AK1849]|nr:HECT-domain-containing protein [Xylariales sp. AK1849]